MKRALLILMAFVLAGPASAACYADYKAKQDDPLRLHYGVVELPDDACDSSSAAAALRDRLDDGWQLLQVISVFDDEDGLEKRKASAGEFFLRY